jgi:hypothetical protein
MVFLEIPPDSFQRLFEAGFAVSEALIMSGQLP